MKASLPAYEHDARLRGIPRLGSGAIYAGMVPVEDIVIDNPRELPHWNRYGGGLDVGYVEAFLLDLGISIFFLIYAFVFNWAYDVIFPVPRPA